MKQRIKSVLRRTGWELRRSRLEGWQPHKLRPLSEAATIIDVGVWRGTQSLYDAFPDAYLLLVDALPEAEMAMRNITRDRPGAYEVVAASSVDGESIMRVAQGSAASTLHQREPSAEKWFDTVEELTVRTATLDSIVGRHELPGPFLLKIDTEGHELDVLQGATETLKQTDCIIAEVSIAPRFKDSYAFSEVVGLLGKAGFEMVEILNVKRDISTTRARFVDAAFSRVW